MIVIPGDSEGLSRTKLDKMGWLASDTATLYFDDLRVPASNLVRNVLEEVFDAVEDVSDDMGGVFEDVLSEAEEARERIERRLRQRRGGRRRRRGYEEDDLENEFRRDEAAEARRDGDRKGRGDDDERERSARRSDREEAEDVEPHPIPDFPDVIGWQLLVLNAAAECARCKRKLRRGDRAYVGVKEAGFSSARLCRRCAPAG